MIALLAIVASAAVFVVIVTKILDVELKKAREPGAAEEVPSEVGEDDDSQSEAAAAPTAAAIEEEDEEGEEEAPLPVPDPDPSYELFWAQQMPPPPPPRIEEPVTATDLTEGPEGDPEPPVVYDPGQPEERRRSRIGASSRLLLTVVMIGAAVSLAIVILVGWLGRLIGAALS